jgi:hypothetical protein
VGNLPCMGLLLRFRVMLSPPGGCSNRALRHRLHEPRHHDQLHELLTACVLNPRRSLRARTARQPRFDSFLCWVHDPARVGMVSPFPAQLYLLCPRYAVGAFFERWVRTGTAMPSRGKDQHIRRERRCLGRFVAFSEMLTDLTPVPLIEPERKAR